MFTAYKASLFMGRSGPTKQRERRKKKTMRITGAVAHIKLILVQHTLAVCLSEKHPEVKSRYLALKKRRGHKKAIIIICRMLLSTIYSILEKSETYNPALYRKRKMHPILHRQTGSSYRQTSRVS
jgi:hypothetical protein